MSLSKGLFFCHACHAKGNLLSFFRDLGLTRDVIERQYRFLIAEPPRKIFSPSRRP